MKLASGTQIGPYEIQSLLGSGGMGEVYRARDTRLNRFVAIKILPQELCSDLQRLSRFEQEARSASALNHQNIVTIHDIGKHESSPFIAMELIEGKTLRQILASGPVPIKDLLNIAIQLFEGLASAHEAGIIHRDLKPENIIVNKEGLAKILDFGLAKLCPVGMTGENASQVPTAAHETASGILLGTVGYMSPEQASGRSADFRSDQFSLAIILYEMATGKSPFRRKTAAETLTAIIREEPEPVESLNAEVPANFALLLRRCLSKEPAERYASTRDLARHLRDLKEHWPASATRVSQTVRPPIGIKTTRTRSIQFASIAVLLLGLLIIVYWQSRVRPPASPTDSPPVPSIVVLPFTPFGNQSQEEYFSDGMTEALITELAKIPGMKVIARNSAFQYKGRNVNIEQVGKELSVNYVLQGSLQRSGDRLRVHAQLINLRTGFHLWAERYDRDSADLFGVQDDISRNIAAKLKLALSETPSTTQRMRPTENLEAYDLYLRGKYLLNNISEEDLNQAIPHLEKAISLDPQFALAYAALGKVYRQKYFFVEPKDEWEEKAFVAIEKAIALDPNLAEAYAGRGRLIWTRKNNYPHEKSVGDYKKAITLDPNLAEAYVYLGGIYHHVGLIEEAIQEVTTALTLDPTNSLARSNRVMVLLFSQQYQQAFSASEQSPGDEIWGALSLLYIGNSQKSEAIMKKLLRQEPERQPLIRVWDASFIHSSYAVLQAKTGNVPEAEKQIRIAIEKDRGLGHFHHSEYNIALAYALMGKTAQALEWLQKTVDHGFACYPFFQKDPHLKNLHGNPEFSALLEKTEQQRNYYRAKFLDR